MGKKDKSAYSALPVEWDDSFVDEQPSAASNKENDPSISSTNSRVSDKLGQSPFLHKSFSATNLNGTSRQRGNSADSLGK
jgi:hypothetical protein